MDQERLYQIVLSYTAYLLTGLLLLGAFYFVYTRITPHDERAQVRRGNLAVAIFLSGAMIGFSATIASGILTHVHYLSFIGWIISALFVQLIVLAVMNRLIPDLRGALESNNVAVGTLGGAAALCAGLINAASVF
jgi:putative membrane protein